MADCDVHPWQHADTSAVVRNFTFDDHAYAAVVQMGIIIFFSAKTIGLS